MSKYSTQTPRIDGEFTEINLYCPICNAENILKYRNDEKITCTCHSCYQKIDILVHVAGEIDYDE